jgi:hypothetical protein
MIQLLYDVSPNITPRVGLSKRIQRHSPAEAIRRYSDREIERDLRRVRKAWKSYGNARDRLAIYRYLKQVYLVVIGWRAVKRSQARARHILRMDKASPRYMVAEPFNVVIFATADHDLDHRARSKWSRCLQFAARNEVPADKLIGFVRRHGGLSKCALFLGKGARR